MTVAASYDCGNAHCYDHVPPSHFLSLNLWPNQLWEKVTEGLNIT